MLKVLKAGFFTTIQDKGRVGFANLGVPVSGAMDGYSADLANSILNNSLQAAVLEVTLGSCKFQFLKKTVICVSGGDFSPTINEKPIALNSRIQVFENDILSFGKVKFGMRCNVAVKAGFLSEIKLNSRSFYQPITKNGLVKKNDLLSYNEHTTLVSSTKTIVKIDENHFNTLHLDCFKGPEFELLSEYQQKLVTNDFFTISNDANRMGIKLNEILENTIPQILTSAVLPGTVQLTPSGKLIVLMRDCQVTGGYPRVLQLTAFAIHKLAQKAVNHKIKFNSV
ncbi:biotin-dependent carboxyltransferase family protein [Polaribacter sp. Hel_I_88]|uniref:5-oxoprolinase subunit C family protein n=1 Tax=Polaribacter sp. Hel_I_88 TaxID=1250006 RepID=UPI0004795D1D|nr:biotin-dependent carboxyltransferase family protein [Polaribacter sp. Hel_I_88]